MMAQWAGLGDLPCWMNPVQAKCLQPTPQKSDGSLTLWTKIGLGVILVLVFLIGVAGLVL